MPGHTKSEVPLTVVVASELLLVVVMVGVELDAGVDVVVAAEARMVAATSSTTT